MYLSTKDLTEKRGWRQYTTIERESFCKLVSKFIKNAGSGKNIYSNL